MDQIFGLQEAPIPLTDLAPSGEPAQLEERDINNLQLMQSPFEDLKVSLRKKMFDVLTFYIKTIYLLGFDLYPLFRSLLQDLMTPDFRFLDKLSHIHSSLANDPPSLFAFCLPLSA